ncbi:ABC transporter substrate-binding protein [Jiangella alba]|uniref:Peptide/nickel transport system substrate-binding protein n=1 Tax=Jiangella alba TaxID=561176 RepID=A0A1H5L381_9ACTN|nr:ABC transporter substrate-binding protein [Jiangella alba]SEE71599.1 peptide/nickel transport system substrate-binding protein [Jiangella alba]
MTTTHAPIHRRRRLAAAASTVLLLVTAACSSGAADDDTEDAAASGEPVRGGELVYLDAEIPISALIQEQGTWQDRALFWNLTDRLVYRNAETGEFEPWIAQSWEVSDDGLRYDFVIRDGVSYSDGTPVDAQSVARNLTRQVYGDEAKGLAKNYAFPDDAQITADPATRTVTVVLTQPWAPLLGALTGWAAGLVADSVFELTREEQSDYTNLVGSGPFTVQSVEYGKSYVLTRRDGYAWAPESSPNQGEAYLDTVAITPVQEDSVRLGTLRSGQAHLLRYVQPSEERALADDGYTIVARSGVGLANQWPLRQNVWPGDDPDVRKALQLAVDREQIIEDLYTENWSAATSVLAPGTAGYTDLSAEIGYDPERAATLLDEAGFAERDADGYRVRDGRRLSLKTYVDVFDNTAKALFQHIQAQFKDLGVEVVIDETDYSSYGQTVNADPAVNFTRTGWPHPDPAHGLWNVYSSGRADSLKLEGADPQLDALLDAGLHAPGADAESAALAETQRYLLENALTIPILNDTQVYAGAPDLHGFTLSDGGLPEYQRAWLDAG